MQQHETDNPEDQLTCPNCGRALKKRVVKNPMGTWDTWDCPFCHP